jgi:hypothetical protein
MKEHFDDVDPHKSFIIAKKICLNCSRFDLFFP